MLYQSFRDLKLSALALGCMRFPLNSASDGDVNEAETARLLDCAMAHGINYYDTAWGYHEGRSELILGRLLKRYPTTSTSICSTMYASATSTPTWIPGTASWTICWSRSGWDASATWASPPTAICR